MQPPDSYNRVSNQATELEGAETMIAMNRTSMTSRFVLVLAIVSVVGLTLLASACGGSSAAKVAQIGTTTGPKPSAASDDPTAYSKCMRHHGVGNFPDPDGNLMKTAGIDKSTPTFKAAARACRSLAPTPAPPAMQAQEQAQMLAFAKCMRSHGVTAFPDPQIENGGVQMHVPPGQIDPSSPIVKAAIAACRSTFVGKGAAIEAQKLVGGLGGGRKSGPRR
jgi:hypothetical protein